ncbi:PQQ-binding-like beta-propeller repeat protein [Streptomyces sp. NPDC057499]|uniref:outer membrane protein assembly factor BamB family protein n=1 Tax=Streptomyces sp. NPDC057499 TaxID=3346150 RepID=UPI0036775C7D
MEALCQDDPRRFGPYTVLARLRETAGSVLYLARAAASDDAVVVAAARTGLASLPAFRRRFQAEARTAERLAGRWVQPSPGGPGGEGDELQWTAAPYLPALTLAEVIGTAGPLPERAVRVLGAGLAETLARVHATGAVLQGLAPHTVLLAGDGPRLVAFGPLGAAADAEARPGGQLSVRLGYLTPEQVAGEEPGPASDLFVLGLLLAYAATGTTPLAAGPAAEGAERIARTAAELGAVPEELRGLVGRCLEKDPAARPSADEVAAELAPEGAAGLAEGGWLPEAVAAAVAEQGVRVREVVTAGEPVEAPAALEAAVPAGVPEAAEAPVPAAMPPADTRTAQLGDIARRAPAADRPTTQLAVPHELTGRPALPPSPGSGPALPAGLSPVPPVPPVTPGTTALPAVPAQPVAADPRPLPVPLGHPAATTTASPATTTVGRRSLFIGLAAGAAGLLVGGGGALALTGGDGGSTDDGAGPSPSHGGPAVAGLPPQPRWVYTHPAADAASLAATVWNERLLVLTGRTGATAVDLRTGRRVWENKEAVGGRAVPDAGQDFCFVATPSAFLWLSPKDGRTVHRAALADLSPGTPTLAGPSVVGASGTELWFTATETVTVKAPPPKKGKKRGKDQQVVKAYLFGYDLARRTQLWRTPVPAGRGAATPVHQLVAVRKDGVVVRQTAATLAPGQVKAAKGKAVFRSYERRTGKPQWGRAFGSVVPDAAAAGDARGLLYAAVGDALQAFETPDGKPKWTLNGTGGAPFGTPVVSGTVLHTTSRNQEVGAVERETGRLRWRRSTEAAIGTAAPAVTLSAGGGTLLAADASQVTAFASADGRRLWKFQDIGAQDPKGPTVTAPYRVLPAARTAVVQRGQIFYAFPVD